jgi:hypothetical protein
MTEVTIIHPNDIQQNGAFMFIYSFAFGKYKMLYYKQIMLNVILLCVVVQNVMAPRLIADSSTFTLV